MIFQYVNKKLFNLPPVACQKSSAWRRCTIIRRDTHTITKSNFACIAIFKWIVSLPGEVFVLVDLLHVGYDPHSFPSCWFHEHESWDITHISLGLQPISLHERPYSATKRYVCKRMHVYVWVNVYEFDCICIYV